MTELLFRDDAYLRGATAHVTAISERGAIHLDRTIFYATSGGQPGDSGRMIRADGSAVDIATTAYEADKATVAHVPVEGSSLPAVGEEVRLVLNWERRHALMRVHTALHLLSVALPYPVTGGQIGEGEGRLDFDIPDAGLDKAQIEATLAEMIATDAPVSFRWITDAELDADPGLVKTMKVKPPRGSGKVRLVEIAGIDLQPCGGTHVRATGEIGRVSVTGVEKKGKQNRRVRIALA
jgi:misacylated tRNA(Ala) deacylase